MPRIKENDTVTETQTTEPLTDAMIDDMAKKFGKELAKQPKVNIRIPKDPLNPKDDSVPVGVNGYYFVIKRGEYVDVPQTVADILREANYI